MMKNVVNDPVPFHGTAELVNLDSAVSFHVEYKLMGTRGVIWGDAGKIAEAFHAQNLELFTIEDTRRHIPISMTSDRADGSAEFSLRDNRKR